MTEAEARIVVAVGAYRAANGEGPRWGWVRATLGMSSHRATHDALHGLRRRGLVAFDDQPGSLTVSARAARDALQLLRDAAARERNAEAIAASAALSQRGRRRTEQSA